MSDARKALKERLGSSIISKVGFRDNYVIIGKRGLPSGSAVEAVSAFYATFTLGVFHDRHAACMQHAYARRRLHAGRRRRTVQRRPRTVSRRRSACSLHVDRKITQCEGSIRKISTP